MSIHPKSKIDRSPFIIDHIKSKGNIQITCTSLATYTGMYATCACSMWTMHTADYWKKFYIEKFRTIDNIEAALSRDT